MAKSHTAEKTLQKILKEVRSLRKEFLMLFPSEDLESYENTAAIKQAYKRADKKHPALWK